MYVRSCTIQLPNIYGSAVFTQAQVAYGNATESAIGVRDRVDHVGRCGAFVFGVPGNRISVQIRCRWRGAIQLQTVQYR